MLKNKKWIFFGGVVLITLLVILAAVERLSNTPMEVALPSSVSEPLTHQQFEDEANKLTAIIQNSDPKASFDSLRTTIKNNASAARSCHPLLHHVGRTAYDKYKDFNKAISYQDGLCNSGYTHGVIEALFIASDDINVALQTTCPVQGEKMTFQQWQCNHGMGHGVMYATAKDATKSIELCETLSTSSAQDSCINGIFMERFIVVSHTGGHTEETRDTSMEVCAQQAEKYKSDCYTYAPTAYLELHTNNYTGAFEKCRTVEKNYIGSCTFGVGGQAMKENVLTPEIGRDICAAAARDFTDSCLRGALSILINHYASTDPVVPLCTTTFARYKEICTQRIESWNATYNS